MLQSREFYYFFDHLLFVLIDIFFSFKKIVFTTMIIYSVHFIVAPNFRSINYTTLFSLFQKYCMYCEKT